MTKPAKTTSTRMATALLYGENGLQIVPLHGTENGLCTCGDENCERRGRHPRTKRGIEDATTDPETIRKYWTKWPGAKIAIATGDGVIAVTVDDRSEALWEEFEAGYSFPDTVEIGDACSHTYLFAAVASDIPEGEFRIADGVTVSGNGAYVVMPASIEASTGKLDFVPEYAVGDVDLAPVPAWLAALIHVKPGAPGEFEAKDFEFKILMLDWITVPKKPPCDREKVKILAESFAVTGVRTPLTVRELEPNRAAGGGRAVPRFALLSDPHQFEAMKSRGAYGCACIVLKRDKTDSRLWQIGELLNQPELSPLDWAELVMEWVQLVRQKDAQIGHPVGGRQPTDKGLSRAGRDSATQPYGHAGST